MKFIQNRENTIVSDKGEETLLACKNKAIEGLSGNFVYGTENELALLQLFRLNIDADTAIGRRFDFSIWKNRSLEHIYPKSKVYHREGKNLYDGGDGRIYVDEQESFKEETFLDREKFKGNGSEHCIGNLVLLHRNDNSQFRDSSFEDKKKIYFNLHSEGRKFYSRNLLHSMSVFAFSTWGVKAIQENRNKFINEMKKFYDMNEDGNNEE